MDENNNITSRRQRDQTTVRQLGCKQAALCSFKDIGKKGLGNKSYILTMKYNTYSSYELTDNPFQFPSYLKSSKEYVEAIHQAKKYQQQVLPYSDSR